MLPRCICKKPTSSRRTSSSESFLYQCQVRSTERPPGSTRRNPLGKFTAPRDFSKTANCLACLHKNLPQHFHESPISLNRPVSRSHLPKVPGEGCTRGREVPSAPLGKAEPLGPATAHAEQALNPYRHLQNCKQQVYDNFMTQKLKS